MVCRGQQDGSQVLVEGVVVLKILVDDADEAECGEERTQWEMPGLRKRSFIRIIVYTLPPSRRTWAQVLGTVGQPEGSPLLFVTLHHLCLHFVYLRGHFRYIRYIVVAFRPNDSSTFFA